MKNCILTLICLATCVPVNAEVFFEWADVGNPGNAPDTRFNSNGVGEVGYSYRISKHEVTNGQYIEFLNAVATVGDSYNLYNIEMASTHGGIERSGSGIMGEPFVYSAKGGDINWLSRPVNYISFFDAMRFSNWLNNGQGNGDTESGAYQIGDENNVIRSSESKYWIPSEDEWYKAAYYDPISARYYNYPTKSDEEPRYVGSNGNLLGTRIRFTEGVEDPGGYATYGGRGIGRPYYFTAIGEWENSSSPYGTYDQAGNVWEWNESNIPSSASFRGGAALYGGFRGLYAGNSIVTDLAYERSYVGFRLATTAIPEPTSAFLISLACGLMAVKDDFQPRSSCP